MSDEPTPPSLRLKPRQPAPVAAPVSEPIAEPHPNADSLPGDPLKLRLKPKAAPPEGSPAEASGIPFSTPVPFSAPPITPASVNPASGEAPSLAPVAARPPLIAVPPPGMSPYSAPKPKYVPTPQGLSDPASSPVARPSPPAIKADKWLAGLVLFVLVLAAAFYGIRFLMKAHPKPQAHVAAPAPDQGGPKLVENPTSTYGKAIAKARDVVAAHDKLETEQDASSILNEPPAAPRAIATPDHTQAVGSEPAGSQPEPPPPPSETFKQFVINMRVSGVFQGEPVRALINGRTVRLGDVLEPNRKIEFYKIDPEAKQLIFRDFTGATVSRHY